jgi:hypothetical protein
MKLTSSELGHIEELDSGANSHLKKCSSLFILCVTIDVAPIVEEHLEQGALPLDANDAQRGKVNVEASWGKVSFFLLFVCHQVNHAIGANLDSFTRLGNPHVILSRVRRDKNELPIR